MEKKQIGILTFCYAVNPGSALQAYGLWKTTRLVQILNVT